MAEKGMALMDGGLLGWVHEGVYIAVAVVLVGVEVLLLGLEEDVCFHWWQKHLHIAQVVAVGAVMALVQWTDP